MSYDYLPQPLPQPPNFDDTPIDPLWAPSSTRVEDRRPNPGVLAVMDAIYQAVYPDYQGGWKGGGWPENFGSDPGTPPPPPEMGYFEQDAARRRQYYRPLDPNLGPGMAPSEPPPPPEQAMDPATWARQNYLRFMQQQ